MDNASSFAGRLDLYNFGRWLALASLIGLVAGLGAAVLTWAVDGVSWLLHHQVVGFDPAARLGNAPAGRR